MPKAQQAPRPAGAGGYRIVAFPREFEHNVWEILDRRFYFILLGSLAFVYGLVIFLANTEYSKEELASKIKDRYLQKFYEAEFITEDIATLSEDEEGAGIGEEALPEEVEEPKDERAVRDEGKRAEGRGQSAAERAARRRAAAAARNEQRAAMEQAVSGTGVLGVLSASGGGGSGDAVYDVLGEEGSGGFANLDDVLSGVGGLQTASSGSKRSQLGARTSSGRATGTAGIDDLIEGGTGPSESKSIARQGDFAIKIDKGSVTGKASKSSGRSADAIGRIVNKHSDAIENCYKSETRLNPNLKGSITVQFTIRPNGRVDRVRTINSTLRNKKVESCVMRRIKSWRFQAIDNKEGTASFRQKFIFSS